MVGLPAEPTNDPLVIGDVAFDAPLDDDPNRRNRVANWDRLAGSAGEVRQVADLIRRLFPERAAVKLTGSKATEMAFRERAAGHRLLHLATHGYFAPEPTGGRDIPELRSAVVFAGANRGSPNLENDGLLTAFELGSLDLGTVGLVVLSACETGLGKAEEGEGVLGLQRALMGAGVASTITTLWRVDDAGTRALMVEFYRNLWERKLPRGEALRQAQLSMLRGDLHRPGSDVGSLSPYYWAGFVLSGDWLAVTEKKRETP